MRLKAVIISLSVLLACCPAFAMEEDEGRRIQAGPSFLEALQKRDSILVWDQFRYGILLKDIEEGTPVALPVITGEIRDRTAREGHLAILGNWQIDSTLVSTKLDSVARYDIRASIVVAPEVPGQFELFPLECLVGKDTLEFIQQTLVVTEPDIDMETFQPNDIKPQAKFPYTFKEIAPWVLGVLLLAFGVWLAIELSKRRKRFQKTEEDAEPAHIKALRKLDRLRGDKYWKPENQKTFYSGVTDTLREYIASRWNFGAKEMTTAEIFDVLKGKDLTPELFKDTRELFERADFVKFAKFTASDEDNATVLPVAVRFVTETYQREIADQAGNDGHNVTPDTDRAYEKKESE